MQPIKRYYLRFTCALIISFLAFQITFSLSSYVRYQHYSQWVSLNLQQRIALDLPWLQLANSTMKQVANKPSVQSYMHDLNQQAIEQNIPVRVQSIQGINVTDQLPTGQLSIKKLVTPQSQTDIQLLILPFSIFNSLSVYPLLASLLLVFLSRQQLRAWGKKTTPSEEMAQPKPKLMINLHERTLSNSVDHRTVQLSNKPFCFYIALLDYCLKYDNAALNHNKNLPVELLELANRYFYRLIELGHTIRKRPDFSSNLDKMLSEIRAALDDVYKECPDLKNPYYPPKAQGEGSRSKLHNYALETLSEDDLEFIGK
ncbi:hypothetical protein [Neptunicella sp.]|uniref:hypothetical protein n=1 Tax=Neptunicella sp. TaxID=2125986 RepID=UPI003F68C7CC